ncbi:MAG: DUF4433 domain-containing protein [Thermodesulfobacteriota bacterium]
MSTKSGEDHFVFSDGHGLATFTNWYYEEKDLDKVDWSVVGERYWADTIDDPDKQRRKQAEFLVHQFCPWEVIEEIGVLNQKIRSEAERILSHHDKAIPVSIRSQWYYYN